MPAGLPLNGPQMIAKAIRDIARLKRLINVPGPWVTVTPSLGITQGSPPFQYRIIGDECELSGGLSGTITSSGTIVANLPTEAQPANGAFFPVGMGTAITGRCEVDTSGNVTAIVLSGTANSIFFCVRYRLI